MQSIARSFNSNIAFSKLSMFLIWKNFFWRRATIDSYDVVTPWPHNPPLPVPDFIVKPSYSKSGIPPKKILIPEKLSEEKLQTLRRTCKLAADILQSLKSIIQIGVTTEEIDFEVHRLCVENRAYPSPLNYQNYPKSCCTSVNNVACHGIPDSRPLQNGDIINVDVTVFREGVHGDCSTMFLIGDVDNRGQKICNVAKQALDEAIGICKPGIPFSQIGEVIEDFVQGHNLTVIPCFTGHGIGTYFHGPPDIYHFKCDKNSKHIMEEGMCFTIEPVIGDGSPEIVILEDGWTAVTEDDSRTAQYEHTVLITKNGVEVLTHHIS